MAWPHPRDVILYARLSYYHYMPFSGIILILSPALVFNPKNEGTFFITVTFVDVTSSFFPSLVPCLKFTLCNVAAKTGNRRKPRFKG